MPSTSMRVIRSWSNRNAMGTANSGAVEVTTTTVAGEANFSDEMNSSDGDAVHEAAAEYHQVIAPAALRQAPVRAEAHHSQPDRHHRHRPDGVGQHRARRVHRVVLHEDAGGPCQAGGDAKCEREELGPLVRRQGGLLLPDGRTGRRCRPGRGLPRPPFST